MAERKFKLSVPCFEYDLGEHGRLNPIDQLHYLLTKYMDDISEKDMTDVLDKDKYIRIMMYRDSPDSDTYAYVYSRSVDGMAPAHHKFIDSIEEELTCRCLCEVNYSSLGYFLSVDKHECKNRKIHKGNIIIYGE
jgi:hypothetical protein